MRDSEGQLKTSLGHFQMRWLVCLRVVDVFLQEAWELQSGISWSFSLTSASFRR